ncbi:MAG TPA: hypothetical protein VGB77_08050 [Abditibacteriaceae bacterium]
MLPSLSPLLIGFAGEQWQMHAVLQWASWCYSALWVPFTPNCPYLLMLILPTPNAEGIAKTKKLFLDQCGREISDEEAGRLLGGVMRFLYLTMQPTTNSKHHTTPPLAHPYTPSLAQPSCHSKNPASSLPQPPAQKSPPPEQRPPAIRLLPEPLQPH